MWKLPDYFISNFNEVKLDYLKFVFEQAEKKLVELVRAGEDITKKAYTILGIAVTVFTLSIGGIFGFKFDEPLVVTALIILSSMAFISIVLLVHPILSYATYIIGSDPSSLFKEELVDNFTNDEDRIKNLFLNESVEYQKRIDYNRKINRQRTRYVDFSMSVLVISPFISGLICWLVSNVF